MDYQDRLKELIKEAEANGYLFENGRFEKVKRDEKFINCLNIHFISAGEGEDAGRYQIFSKSYLLSEKDMKAFMDVAKEINKSKQFEDIFDAMECREDINTDFLQFVPEDYFSDYSDNWIYINENMKKDEADDYFSINSKYLSGSLEVSLSHIPLEDFNKLQTVNVKKHFYWKFG